MSDTMRPNNSDFVRIADYVPNLRVELPYATEDNFTNHVIYEFQDAYLRYGTVKKLEKASSALAEQHLGLVIWDAFRPVYAQERLWEICPDPNFVSPPGRGRQPHCRGLAVDVTLYSLDTGAVLEMPSEFDDFTGLAHRSYIACSREAARNAGLLEQIMENCGFKPYSAEWWHFSDSEDYEIEYQFDPAQMN